jgi:uncharacterized protein with von Willebrand factor type A (vWA) domain
MNTRTKEYFKRRKAYDGVIHFTDIKSLLKAEFYSTANPVVKRDILKAYHALTHPGEPFSLTKKS